MQLGLLHTHLVSVLYPGVMLVVASVGCKVGGFIHGFVVDHQHLCPLPGGIQCSH